MVSDSGYTRRPHSIDSDFLVPDNVATCCPCGPQSPGLDSHNESDERLLEIFRQELMPHFPFVTVPQATNANILNGQRPFLMSAIRLVAGLKRRRSSRRQMAQIMNQLASQMLLRAECSVDLLAGVVLVLGWYHFQCMRHSQLNNLLCLAESLAAGLGLWKGDEETPLEGKRLCLGVWYLRSSASAHYQLLSHLPFSQALSRHANVLAKAKEYETDKYLLDLISIQRLTEQTLSPESNTQSITSQIQQKLDSLYPSSSLPSSTSPPQLFSP